MNLTRLSVRHVTAGIFAALFVVELVSIGSLRYFVTEDGPMHLDGAMFLARFNSSPFLNHYFYAQAFPVPNLSTELILAGLVRIVTPDLAEKLLQAGYVLFLPLAVLYAVRGISPRADWLALFGFVFTFTFTFQFGFYSFSVGVALFLMCVGHTVRMHDRPGVLNCVVLAGLFLLTYAPHLVPFMESVLFAVTFVAWEAIFDACHERGAALPARLIVANAAKSVGPVLAAAEPALVLTVAYRGVSRASSCCLKGKHDDVSTGKLRSQGAKAHKACS